MIRESGLVWREHGLSENGRKGGCEEKEGRSERLKESRGEMRPEGEGGDGGDDIGD